jgi:hypothetical protein
MINPKTLQKGDYISSTTVERITGEVYGTTAYQLALMGLQQSIEHALIRLGRRMTLKSENGGIRLLTDPEAAEYNAHQGELARHKLSRAFHRNQAVNDGNLDFDERTTHYRTLEIQGKYIQAMRRVRRELKVEPVRRLTPTV